jgi:threonine dehydratase
MAQILRVCTPSGAAAIEGKASVAGVEPAAIPTLHAALTAGQPVDAPAGGIAADSLGATRLGDIARSAATRARVQSGSDPSLV